VYGTPDLVSKEFEIQQKINSIDPNISPLVYYIKQLDQLNEEDNALPSIVELLSRSKINISTLTGMVIPPPNIPRGWDRRYHMSNAEEFTLVVMQHAEGINWSSATITRNVLEDLRLKINLLHSGGIYHCDLHPDNILVHNGEVKIIDFGFAVESDVDYWEEKIPCAKHPTYTLNKRRNEPQNSIDKECGEGGETPCIN